MRRSKALLICVLAAAGIQVAGPSFAAAPTSDPKNDSASLATSLETIASGAEAQGEKSGQSGDALVATVSASIENFLIGDISAGIPAASLRDAVEKAFANSANSPTVGLAIQKVRGELASLLGDGIHPGALGGGSSLVSPPPPATGGEGYRK